MQYLNLSVENTTSRRGHSVRARRRGSIAVIAAAGTVAVLGFCALSVDLGRAAATRNKLQRACDAAALAGAQNLPDNPNEARRIAVKVAALNGAPGVLQTDIAIYDRNTTIRVPAKQNIGYGFASVFNMRSATVVGAAVAKVEPASQVKDGIVPIAITPDTYLNNKNGTSFTIQRERQNKGTLGNAEFLTLNLDDNGKSVRSTQEQIQWGWNGGPIRTDDTATSNNASGGITNALERSLNDRFTRARESPWFDVGIYNPNTPRDNPRVMTLVLTPPTTSAVNGTYMAPIKGFVTVYVEAYDSSTEVMRLRVLSSTSSDVEGTAGDPAATGVRSIRLID